MLGKENMGSVKKDMVLAGKAAAGAAAAGMVKGLVLDDSDLGDITFDNEGGLDLFTDHGTGTGLFLDRFSKDDIWRMMEELQIQDRIRARSSHSDLSLSFDLRDPFVHKMYLRSSAVDEPLCELFLRIFHNLSNFHIVEDCPQTAQGAALVKSSLVPSTSEGELRLLFAEWMLLQDPAAPIDGKMLLPGQRYPGLGVANQFGELLLRMGKELSCDAFINRPLFFHNALLYAGTHAFLNPEVDLLLKPHGPIPYMAANLSIERGRELTSHAAVDISPTDVALVYQRHMPLPQKGCPLSWS